jgi:DNA-binding CsgD family transcriptional regulator
MGIGASSSTFDDRKFPDKPLTQQERQVVRLVALGNTNQTIGMILFISPHTVHSHLYRARIKLRALDRTHMVALAFRYGMLRWDGDRLLICADDL